MVVIERIGLPVDHPARLHPRRQGHGHRGDADEFARDRRRRARREPDQRDPHRAVDRRLEGVRARGHARPRRQLRGHLLDRELRPDGRAHRRLDHGRAGPDAVRRRVPARCATPRSRASAASASRPAARNVQFAVDPDDRRHGRHRDEPARVSRSSRARVEGDRLPDRQDRGPPRGRLHARRDPERHHHARRRPASSRRSTTSSRRCPRWAFEKLPGTTGVLGTQMQSVGEAMAIGRTFPESLQKGVALARARAGSASTATRPRPRSTTSIDDELLVARGAIADARAAVPARGRPASRASASSGSPRPPGSTRWFLDQIARIVEERAAPRRHRASTGMDRRTWRRAKRLGFSDAPARLPVVGVDEADVRAARLAAGVRGHVQDRRHLRAPSSRPSTPYHYSHLRGRGRGASRRAAPKVVILGSGPNRIGQGIEFDYCCVHASLRAARRRLRDRDGQLQPRDGVDRLRHERPALLRAAHARGRAQRHRGRAGRIGRDRGARRPDAAQAGRPCCRPSSCSARAPESIDLAEDRERWNALCARLEIPQPAGGTATDARRRRSPSPTRVGLPGARAPVATCSAGGRWRSSTTTTSSRARWTSSPAFGQPRARGRPVGRAAGAHRPLPRGRDRGRRRRHPRPRPARCSSAA